MDSSKYDEKYCEAADRVLIDVPCSGLGLIRKKPEIKWTKSQRNLRDILELQRNIMDTSSKYVKAEGILMYSTCTLNKEENEENINWFLNKYKEFEIEPLYFGKASNIMYNSSGSVTILPNKYMDGFFICKLKKHGRC
jgi:16S rRNA (cytosine967-C5)-methyltransferase